MKWLLLSVVVVCLLALGGCKPTAPMPGTPPSGEIVLPRARVKEFLTDPSRSILLTEAVNGVSQVWLDEWGAGSQVENRTQTYSAANCYQAALDMVRQGAAAAANLASWLRQAAAAERAAGQIFLAHAGPSKAKR